MRVSIISPIYKGKQYIPALISQAEACKNHAGNDIEIELVLSNDYPEEPLGTYESDIIDILVINTPLNQGIQAARINGLKESNGEYIVFLDQDDILYPDYVRSQIDSIADGDAVVCRCINEGRLNYNKSAPFEKLITREYMLSNGDPIVSTGSVLIRRNSIPKTWKDNILKISGADDYFLWLCMLAMDCKFSLNQKVVFEHVVNGINTSLNTQRMINSEHEMFQVIKKLRLFPNEEDSLFDRLEENIKQRHIRLLDKFRLMFFTLNNIIELQENNTSLAELLSEREVKRLVIYGAGYLGKRIFGFLKRSDIEIIGFADQNAEYANESIPVYLPDDIPDDADSILITLVQGAEGVIGKLRNDYTDRRIIELTELLNS